MSDGSDEMTVDPRLGQPAGAAPTPTPAPDRILLDLLLRARECLSSFAGPELAHYLRRWPRDPAPRTPVAQSLPVVRVLEETGGESPAFSTRLLAALRAATPLLTWRQTYPVEQMGKHLAQNYGWTEFVGPRGLVPGSEVSCGILLLGARTHYPSHAHEAEEIYVPLSGRAHWQQGTGAWLLRPPGALIHHARDVPHAMRTEDEPLIALYLWRSANLRQSAHMDQAASASAGPSP